MDTVKVNIKDKTYSYKRGVKLEVIANDFKNEYKGIIALGVIDNKLKDLSMNIDKDCNIKFIDTTNADGMRVYTRTLALVFIKACEEIFPKCRITIEHSLSEGLYCEVGCKKDGLSDLDIINIKNKMTEIIDNNEEILKISTDKENAIKIFEQNGKYEKAELLKYKEYNDVKIYKCGCHINHFYGYMLPSTQCITLFDIKKWKSGVVILGPNKKDKNIIQEFIPQPKLSAIYKEAEDWSNLMGVDKVITLNKLIEDKKYNEIIRIVEALHEKKISQIADMIKMNQKRVILIAAPSSSGKTSF
ncbi:MAG: nucleoside kinase, partial [Paraclostridium sp.]